MQLIYNAAYRLGSWLGVRVCSCTTTKSRRASRVPEFSLLQRAALVQFGFPALTLGLLFPMPQAAISTSHTGPHGCFFECSCTPELCFPQHWEILVLQQDLSNTPLAPAILQLCLCQVDLTCTKKTGLGLTESPGPQS